MPIFKKIWHVPGLQERFLPNTSVDFVFIVMQNMRRHLVNENNSVFPDDNQQNTSVAITLYLFTT